MLCACIGPAGDCPCIRERAGLPQRITETYVAPEVFESLPDADKNLINELKVKALGLFMAGKRAAKKDGHGQ